MDKREFIEKKHEEHEADRIFYTSCPANGCWDSACVLKCSVKHGKIISIEPDDTINRNDSREDCGWQNIWEGQVQMRPCAMGHSWKKELYAETRLLHPMKRVGEKGAGKGYFVRISWEEALDTIAEKMKDIRGKYGPYSIFHSQYPSFEKNGFPLAPWWEAGFGAWGEHSCSGHGAGEIMHIGVNMPMCAKGVDKNLPGFEASDVFNSKLLVMWGMDPVVTWFGPTSYYMMLAHEYGCKTIVIDPRYTQSAELIADQWIPIRPGTDLAMMLAVAQVLYEEDLYDHEFVSEWVEPTGFERWRSYVMGEDDGIKKTPEWAAPICAVPADTIREFARLYGTTKPVHLQYFYSCAKRHLGDYSASASMLLQAMTGNIACAGGCESGACLPTPGRVPTPYVKWRDPSHYKVPVLFNNNCLTEILAHQKDYWQGRLSEDEFRHLIGSPSEDAPLPNIQMIIFENNYANNHSNTNKRLAGMASTEFNWGFQWHLNQPTAEVCDIILPAPVWQFEGMDEYMYGHQRFVSGPNGMRNYFTFCARGVDFPGEVRSKEWVYTQIAKRLGDEVVEGYNPRMKDVEWDDWVDTQEAIYKEAFEEWASNETIMAYLGYDRKPTWEEFNEHPVVRTKIDVPYYPFKTMMEAGESPFLTPSGKVEFVSSYIENHDMTETRYRGLMDPMPVWQPSYLDSDIGHASNDGFYNPKVKNYPLSLVTPVSIYRQHSSNDNNPYMREDCYRHAVWISGVDAQQRGIKDGDLCRVYSDRGEMVLTAYVTNRCMPGTAAVHHGGWYQIDGTSTDRNKFGEDVRGACNILLDDGHLPHILGALIIAGLVEVEKIADGDDEGFGQEAERGGMRGASVMLGVRRALGEEME